MKRLLTALVLLAAALPLRAQQAQEAQPPAAQPQAPAAQPQAPAQGVEKLGAGDAVRVTVFGQPDLTTEARISDKGTISLPLIGETKIGGLSSVTAASHIADALKKGQYLKNPQVTVATTAVRSRQVSVLGQIARPGRYVLEEAKPQLTDVIAAAGGTVAGASEQVTVIRNGESKKVDGLAKSFELQPGDTVVVEKGPMFYVYGEVTRAGAYPLAGNLTVIQAIALGGGITPRGSERRLKLRRAGPDGKVVESDVSPQDTVKADDVIFVKEALF
jgi:polysaccharide export outer membrane protein